MKTFALLILSSVFSLSLVSLAKDSSPRTPAQAKKNSKKPTQPYSEKILKGKLDELLAEADYANGDAGTLGGKFSTSKWSKEDYASADRRISENWPEDCGKPNLLAGRKKILVSVASTGAGDDKETADRLSKLWTKGNLIAATGAEWDGTGDSESCSVYRYHFYFNDGTGIYIDYEFTD